MPEPSGETAPKSLDDRLFDAARSGNVAALTALLDEHPARLQLRDAPYGQTLLHLAAVGGHLACVNLLLDRGLDVNARDVGDNCYAMHWAAAAGHPEVVRRLADAGGDVVGDGDDHALGVIGWATCWDDCDDAAHHAVADLLISRGASHHIYSAIAFGLSDEVRRIVARDPAALRQPQSHNEDHRLPLHFAVRQNRPAMVALLLELGADPLGRDGSGQPPLAYAATTDCDRPICEALRARGQGDLFTALALGDEAEATRILAADPALVQPGGASAGVLHLMAKRGNVAAVRWLLGRGVDPDARWSHWGADVVPLHLAVMHNHADVVRLLLGAGADPGIRDSQHDSDPFGWAVFFQRPELVALLKPA